ncbi:MAG: hypothetical protein ACK44A_07270 [Roseateles sp.]
MHPHPTLPSSHEPSHDHAPSWACWLAEPGRAELRPEPLRAPGAEEVQVRTLHSG